jgi:hypothetical protein
MEIFDSELTAIADDLVKVYERIRSKLGDRVTQDGIVRMTMATAPAITQARLDRQRS